MAVAGVLAALAIPWAASPVGRADGDPASDVLFAQPAFFPYEPAVAPTLAGRLSSLLAQAQRDGYPVRVAIIASATDLGGVPALYGRPQAYAKFLSMEMKSFYSGAAPSSASYLVAMPDGLGLARAGKLEQAAPLQGLTRPQGANIADSLTEEATVAVERLAAARGLHLVARAIAPVGGGGTPVGAIAAMSAVAVALAAALLWARNRRAGLGRAGRSR